MGTSRSNSFQPTGSYATALRHLYIYHRLTALQLARLMRYNSESYHRAQEICTRLFQTGYVERANPAYVLTAKNYYARLPYWHGLTRKGYNQVGGDSLDISFRHRPGELRELGSIYLQHEKELNDLLITASFLPDVMPGIVYDPLTDLQHEWMLKRYPVYFDIELDQGVRRGQLTYKLIPDAFIRFGYSDGTHLPLLLEYDRATEFRQKFTLKIKALLRFVLEGYFAKQFGTTFVTITFVTPFGEHRRDMLLGYTEEVLTELHLADDTKVRNLFRFAALPRNILDPLAVFTSPISYKPFIFRVNNNKKEYYSPQPLVDPP